MILEHLQLRGFSSAFPGVVDLPLDTIEPGLVALVGGNGHGKTTTMETVPAVIFGKLPARGDMGAVDFAVGRDSYITLTFAFADVRYRARLSMDAQTRKTEAVLERDVDGRWLPLNDGKVTTFRQEIAPLFPSLELFVNSVFAAQGRGDEFARTKPSARKELFAEFLNLGQLLAKSATAKAMADLYDDARRRLEMFLEQAKKACAPQLVDAIGAEANRLQVKGGEAELRHGQLRTQIDALETREQLAGDQVAAFAAAKQRLDAIGRQIADRVDELARARRTRDTEATDAAGRRQQLEQQRTRNLALLDAQLGAANNERAQIDERRRQLLAAIDERIAGNQQLQGKAEVIRHAVAEIERLRVAYAEQLEISRGLDSQHQQALADLRAADQALSAFVGTQKDLDRVKTDSALLTNVPCHGAGEYAACQFLTNARTAQARIADLEAAVAKRDDAIRVREQRETALQTVETARMESSRRLSDLQKDAGAHKELADYLPRLEASNARVEELRTQRHDAEIAAARDLQAADTRYEERQAALRTQRGDLDIESGRALAAQDARTTARLAECEAAIAAVHGVIARLEAERYAAQQDYDAAAAGNGAGAQLQAELRAARAEWDAVNRTLAEVASGRQELERRRAEIEEARQRVALVGERLARVQTHLLEWRELQKALGKGGLPDLEIDAAGPSISATVNELLLACYGPRFSLELVTQTEKADGSGMRDEFTVRVLDNDEAAGGWRDINELSGGEKVIVQEALMCAIAVFVNERSPRPIRTLFRDETGAALDGVNAVRYVQMLRKARERGGFVHVWFISHNPEVQALADTQIRVGGGQARIVEPPFQEAA